MGLWYSKDSGFELTAFLDADHARCINIRKITSRGIQFLGDKLVSWMSKKQDCTAMSSAEAEYMALSASCAQVMWMRTQLKDYGFNYNKIPLYCNSQSTIAISCNSVQHSRAKHIHTRYHFIKEHVENGIIELYFIRTEYQLADMFTKALHEDSWKSCQEDSSKLNLPDHRFIKNFSKIATSLTIFTWKSNTFDWGGEQELAFQTLKDKLCNAPVLALSNRPEDFVVYYDASRIGLGYVLMQRGKIELFSDYDCKIRYHPGNVNVVVDALSKKEKVKPKRVRAMNIVLQSSMKYRILAAQKEAVDESTRLQKGLDVMIELRTDRVLYYLDRIWVPLKGDVRTLIIDEVHRSKYSIHSGADKMYYDIRDRYWWPRMKKDIAEYIRITMDFVTKLPRTSSGHDTIWIIMDRLTKSADFLPMREDYKMDRLARLYLNEIVARHGVPISIISDLYTQKLTMASQITRDAVTHTHLKTTLQDFQTASVYLNAQIVGDNMARVQVIFDEKKLGILRKFH
ncbi:putative reverse transcriptase domain-containing protein [Tanacetum coccineum]